ncbi:MAG TPA: 3-dehydroquinate synthase [Chitinophagales bacterium]|nr:3-dehydroquinate synthase [Chitinophagales bacterium]HRK28621.1 3-dehydroquinate synthase [Chitinophagales bacterium]
MSDPYQLHLPDHTLYVGDLAQNLPQFLQSKPFSKVFILTDTNTRKLCLPALLQIAPALSTATVLTIKPGERHKNLKTCQTIWKTLLQYNADRNALLINLGGGVVCDMGGFCAAAYKRGIGFIHIPTTLLAQVDASVGGKTGIDFEGVKNSIGFFANPLAGFIDPIFLKTLPLRQFNSGFAEMIKHGLIKDAGHLNALQTWLEWFSITKPKEQLSFREKDLIFRSIKIKHSIVKEDPTEKGVRKLLNFGHTIGHALESYSLANDKNPLLHGEAVLLGMYAEMYLSCSKTGFDEADMNKVIFATHKLLPQNRYLISDQMLEQILHYMDNDKKNSHNKIKCTLLTQIGAAGYDYTLSETEIKRALNFLNKF